MGCSRGHWWRIVKWQKWLWQVSVPVDKAIGLIKWVQSLGHEVPELQELDEIKRRQGRNPLLHAHSVSQLISGKSPAPLQLYYLQRPCTGSKG